MLIFLLI